MILHMYHQVWMNVQYCFIEQISLLKMCIDGLKQEPFYIAT